MSATDYGHTEVVNVFNNAQAAREAERAKEGVLFIIVRCGFWVLCGAILFAIYYFVYKRTIKKRGSVQITSFVVRTPLIIGCINVIGLTLIKLVFFVLDATYDDIFFFVLYLCGMIFLIPISIASFAISLLEYKKKIITGKRLIIICLMHSISIALLFFWSFEG